MKRKKETKAPKLKYYLFIVISIIAYKLLLKWLPLEPKTPFSYFGMQLGILVVVLAVFLLVTRRSPIDFGFRLKFGIRHVLYGLSILFLISLAGRLVAPGFDLVFYNVSGMAANIPYYLLVILAAVVVEEFFYRGMLQSALQRIFSLPVLAFGLAIHFGLAHVSWSPVLGMYNNAVQITSIFLASFVIITLYYLTRSLLAAILLHLLSNLLNVWQIYIRFNYTPIFEIAFWVCWGLLSLYFLATMHDWLKQHLRQGQEIQARWYDYLFMVLFAFSPLIFFLF